MEKALQSYGVPLEALKQIKHELAGDLPQIWTDRPWHPLTRTEIYALIWVSNELGFSLPRLVLERIAFWIQLIELCKDFRTKSLSLHIVVETWLCTAIELSKYGHKFYWESGHFAIENKNYIIIKNNQREWFKWGKERREQVLGWTDNEHSSIYARAARLDLATFLETRDCYRIPTDPELRNLLQQLNC